MNSTLRHPFCTLIALHPADCEVCTGGRVHGIRTAKLK